MTLATLRFDFRYLTLITHGARQADSRSRGVLQNSYESLREGDIVTGEVVAMHLLHGAVVDLGCNFDGLVPVTPGQWEKIQDNHPGCLVLESIVKARVHKVRPRRLPN